MFGMIVGILFGVYVIAAVINVAGVIIGAVFSGIGSVIGGLFSLTESAFTGEGLVAGIVLGILIFCRLKKRNAGVQSEAEKSVKKSVTKRDPFRLTDECKGKHSSEFAGGQEYEDDHDSSGWSGDRVFRVSVFHEQ